MALDANIVERLISSTTDKRLQIGGGYWARKMKAGSDWTKLRIGMRWSTNRTTSWTSAPYYYWGLSSGTSDLPGSLSPQHFFGLRPQHNWTVSSTIAFTSGNASTRRISHWKGGVESAESWSASSSGILVRRQDSDTTSGIFIELEKSGGNISLNLYSPNNGAAVSVDEFYDTMEAASVSYTDLGGGTSALDEATYGALDTVCFSWLGEGVDNSFEISDIAVRRMA